MEVTEEEYVTTLQCPLHHQFGMVIPHHWDFAFGLTTWLLSTLLYYILHRATRPQMLPYRQLKAWACLTLIW